eukprot:EG_transcript_21009
MALPPPIAGEAAPLDLSAVFSVSSLSPARSARSLASSCELVPSLAGGGEGAEDAGTAAPPEDPGVTPPSSPVADRHADAGQRCEWCWGLHVRTILLEQQVQRLEVKAAQAKAAAQQAAADCAALRAELAVLQENLAKECDGGGPLRQGAWTWCVALKDVAAAFLLLSGQAQFRYPDVWCQAAGLLQLLAASGLWRWRGLPLPTALHLAVGLAHGAVKTGLPSLQGDTPNWVTCMHETFTSCYLLVPLMSTLAACLPSPLVAVLTALEAAFVGRNAAALADCLQVVLRGQAPLPLAA